MKTPSILTTLVLSFAFSASAFAADIDLVFRKGDTKSVGGQITAVSKLDVVVTQKVGNREEKIAANEIERVEYQAEPPGLNLARSQESNGQFKEALVAYQDGLNAAGSNQNLKGEIEFLIARTLSKIAQADVTQQQAAIDKMNAFLNSYRDHYRTYPMQLLLAETALLAGQTDLAETAFGNVAQAPWPAYQMLAQAGKGQSLLSQQKTAEAKALFDQVVATNATTPAEKAVVLGGMLGQAECFQMMNQNDQAIEVLKKVVNDASAEETRVLANAYVQLGNVYSVDGQHAKEAVLAYLHVDVIPSLATQSDLHAEALYHLSKLWPAIGQPGRGAEASAKLQSDYQDSVWTQKLTEGQ
ncbi:tetratricopeptide repeat protein [Planctomicrobium sp. SH668]|uniref:tetratricopeptide repeat protein n=1 Tax=Planctomicrobium sp. SH668 TaxID=3448126 RepID=UPI003F5B8F9B